jgi:hypothetical protein
MLKVFNPWGSREQISGDQKFDKILSFFMRSKVVIMIQSPEIHEIKRIFQKIESFKSCKINICNFQSPEKNVSLKYDPEIISV